MKEVHATGEAIIPQKITSSPTSKQKISTLFPLFAVPSGIRIQSTKTNVDPCGSGCFTVLLFYWWRRIPWLRSEVRCSKQYFEKINDYWYRYKKLPVPRHFTKHNILLKGHLFTANCRRFLCAYPGFHNKQRSVIQIRWNDADLKKQHSMRELVWQDR